MQQEHTRVLRLILSLWQELKVERRWGYVCEKGDSPGCSRRLGVTAVLTFSWKVNKPLGYRKRQAVAVTPKPCLLQSFPWAQNYVFFASNWSRSFGAVLETWSSIYSMRGLFSWGTMGCFSIFWELKKSVRECHWQSSTLQFWSEDLLCFELSATNPHYTCCSFCHFNWWIHTHIDLSNIKQTPNCKRGKAAVLLLWQWCTVGLLTYVNPPRMTSPSFLG